MRGRLGSLRKDVSQGIQLSTDAAQDIAVTGYIEQGIDETVYQHQSHQGGNQPLFVHASTCISLQPQGRGDQQGGKAGLHRPEIESG